MEGGPRVWVEVLWKNIVVGDIIRLEDKSEVSTTWREWEARERKFAIGEFRLIRKYFRIFFNTVQSNGYVSSSGRGR